MRELSRVRILFRCQIPAEVLKLVAPGLNGSSFVSLAHTSKQLHSDASVVVANNEALVRRWLLDLITTPAIRTRLFKLAWLLKQAAIAWGIIPLAQRLNLQDMLVTCEDAFDVITCLVQAGARITYDFVVASAFKPVAGVATWVGAYRVLGISIDLPVAFQRVCIFHQYDRDQLQKLSAEQYYHLVALVLADINGRSAAADELLSKPRCRLEWDKAQVQRMVQLRILAGEDFMGSAPSMGLDPLLALPAAKEFSREEGVQLVEFAAANGFHSMQMLEFVLVNHAPLPVAVIYQLCSYIMLTAAKLQREGQAFGCLEMLCGEPAAEQLTVAQLESLLDQSLSSCGPLCALQLLELQQTEFISVTALRKLLDMFATSAAWRDTEIEFLECLAGVPMATLLQLLWEVEGQACPSVQPDEGMGCSSCLLLAHLSDYAGVVAELSKEEKLRIASRGIHHRAFDSHLSAVVQDLG